MSVQNSWKQKWQNPKNAWNKTNRLCKWQFSVLVPQGGASVSHLLCPNFLWPRIDAQEPTGWHSQLCGVHHNIWHPREIKSGDVGTEVILCTSHFAGPIIRALSSFGAQILHRLKHHWNSKEQLWQGKSQCHGIPAQKLRFTGELDVHSPTFLLE